jgi:hypothetical protein
VVLRPWHLVVAIVVIAIVAFIAKLVSAFKEGRDS